MHLAQNVKNRLKTEKNHDAATVDTGCFIKVVVSVQKLVMNCILMVA